MGEAKRLTRQAFKGAAAAADGLRKRRPGVVVLIYHRVGGQSASQVDLPVDLFAHQMEVLAEQGRVLTLDSALERLAAAPGPGPDPVVVTFDDGTADFAEHAFPILERYAIPATLYLATDFVERQVPFADGAPPLSWAALADTTAGGLVSVGSHTHTHALLDRLSPSEVDDELDRSIELIEGRLGARPLDFAYPKALPGSAAAEAAVRSRFRSAALAATRTNPYRATDPYRLARSPVQTSDGMRWFRRKLDGGMGLEDDVRRLVNRRRYSGATT